MHKYTSSKYSTQNYHQRCTTHHVSYVPHCSSLLETNISIRHRKKTTEILTYNTYLITQFNKVTKHLLRTSAEKSLVFFFHLSGRCIDSLLAILSVYHIKGFPQELPHNLVTYNRAHANMFG